VDLVTGATGILGSHVALALLKRGRSVKALRRGSSNLTDMQKLFSHYGERHLADRIVWVDGDLDDSYSLEQCLEEVEHVYHCAGYVSFDARDREQLFRVNERGTRNIVNACLFKQVNALCFASSLATIRNTDIRTPLTEEVFWKSTGKESHYAISKYNAEREVWRGIEEGLHAVIVNPGILLAPGFWRQSSSKLFPRCATRATDFTPTALRDISQQKTRRR
jgi:dihydroflavonol-4-reductase